MGDILLLGAGRGSYGGGGGGGGGGTITRTIAAGADDGSFLRTVVSGASQSSPTTYTSYRPSDTFARTRSLYDDDVTGYSWQKAYFRFQNITVAQGATISEAFFKPYVYAGSRTGFTIVGTDVDNVSAPSAASDGNHSLHTTATVSWSNPGTDGSQQTSPDIKTIIQEIVNRSGWSSGNAIMIQMFVSGTVSGGDSGSKTRDMRSYEYSSASKAAQLTITT